MSAALRFDPESHTYTLGSRVLPSVTQVCNVLSPNAYAFVPPDVLERKRAIGVALHYAIALDCAGDLDEGTVAPEIAPYFAAWREFMLRTRASVIETETQHASVRYGYAGTLDLVVLMNDAYWLLDVKSVAVLSPVTAVQVAAYAEMLHGTDYWRGMRRGALHLKPDGLFEIREYVNPNDFTAFLAALSVLQWRQRNGA